MSVSEIVCVYVYERDLVCVFVCVGWVCMCVSLRDRERINEIHGAGNPY